MKRMSRQNIPRIVALVLFLVCLFATVLFSTAVVNRVEKDFEVSLNQRASAREAYYTSRVQSFNRVALSSASMFAVKETLTNDDWQHFFTTMHLSRDFPALLGLGYAGRVDAAQKAAYEKVQSVDRGIDFKITPEGARDEYTAITYIAPDTAENQLALGYDMFAEPARRAAMEQARDTNTPTMSAPVTLIQDQRVNAKEHPGVLIYSPVYRTGADISTVEARRAALRGYVYVAFRPYDILESYARETGDTSQNLRVVLNDVTDARPVQLYAVSTIKNAARQSEAIQRTVRVNNRSWQISVSSVHTLLSRFYEPVGILLFGAVASGVVALVVYLVLLRRMSHVHEVYENEVERTKDELLALTSHQLRTPASGVKQYVGMLTAGLVGELTPAQHAIAQKAYDANERQLQIINELLYVSKADAGELVIEPREMDLTAVTRLVVDTFADRAREKQITVVFSSREPRIIHGDKRYLQMAIENLLSNAIKYSYEGTEVRVELYDDGDTVKLAVRDRGVGVSEADLPRLFSKFDRIDNPLSYSEGGSGLGLFLARQLIVAHGGDITVESEEGKGSTFTIALPKKSDVTSAVVTIRRSKKQRKR